MIHQGIDFHNVEQLIPFMGGYKMGRLPEYMLKDINTGIRESTNLFSAGIELRFRLKSESAVLSLCTLPGEEAQIACLYYGSFQGGWKTSTYVIGTEPVHILVQKPENLEKMRELTRQEQLPYSPDVFRLVLPSGQCVFIGAEGETEPPRPEDVPQDCYLAYGSSITHGSLGLVMPYSYPFRIAQKLKCDYLNLGFAGSAQMEPAMARYIVSRRDWTFASVEMGVNMLGSEHSVETFERNIDAFSAIFADDPRPVFATSIFGLQDKQERAEELRTIVRKYAESRLIFLDGLDILDHPAYLSQDMVHPSLEGMEQIVERWSAFMNAYLASASSGS